MSTSVSTTQLNLRIISIVVFTCICYLSIGLPLAVLPGYIHYQLGYSTFVAGIVISLQYISTLISLAARRALHRYLGAEKSGQPWDRLLPAQWRLHATGGSPAGNADAGHCRAAGGPGVSRRRRELYRHRRHPVGDQNRRRDPHVTGYLLERRGDLCGDGGRGAAGSYPQSLFWHQRLCYGGSAGRGHRSAVRSYPPGRQGDRCGARAPFHAVVRKIWPYGLGLAFGTVGFGVIATFITLYFAAHSWQGAAFTLSLFSVGFICVRLVLGNTITRFGGVPVSLACFIIESLGLLLIWLAPSAWMADVGAFLTGSGFSLVFPALGVEAVKQVEEQNQGTALGTYSAFLDLALGLTGPLAILGRRVLRSRHAVYAGGDRGGARIPADFPRTSATAACRQRVVWLGSRAAAVR